MLKFPDFTKPFIGIADASKGYLGGCLAQLDENSVEQPVAYTSTPLTDAQTRYGITDKEGLGVVWFTKRFRKYLLSSAGNVIVTDHQALLSLRRPKKEFTDVRLYRYAVELDQYYPLTLAHRPGREQYMADMLSRAQTMQDEDQIRQAIAHSWAHTAQLSTAALDLQDRLFELEIAQLRLQTQVRGATVPGQEGTPTMFVSEAIACLQAGLGKSHQGSTTDDHELQGFDG